ncbi:MAG: hypothetical protein R2724_05425 [Bryobacterales bacterium]
MAELTPDEAKVHYNLGQLYKQEDRDADAQAKIRLAASSIPASLLRTSSSTNAAPRRPPGPSRGSAGSSA